MSWVLVKIVGNTLTNLNGTVRSLWPGHEAPPYGPYHWEEKPAGSPAGGFEQMAVNGGTVAYNPTGQEVLLFPFIQNVPHSDGLSAIMENPIQIETVPL